MQIHRLFEIVYLLLEKKTITAKELAKKFEVSTRTIYRDIEVLSSANIPVYANKGKGGGISLLEDYILDKSILSEKEQNEILFALQSFNKINNQEEQTILEKLSNLFQKHHTNWIEVDFSHWRTFGEKENTFESIKTAILQHKVLIFTYYNSYGNESRREVEPLQIYFKDRAWYLKAYCKKKQDFRLFKMARIRDIEITQEDFNRELPERIEVKNGMKMIALELEISSNMAFRVYDEFEKEEIQQKANGDFIIKVNYPENDWIYGYILSYGEAIKVIAPKRVKKEIKEKLEKSLKNYKI